jgi:hypothetical protein
MAWGDNTYGELGDGSATGPDSCGGSPCSKVPVLVPGLSGVVAIAAGYYDSVALLSNGTVVAWGYTYYGEDGDGTGTQTGCECVDTPTPVPGLSGVMAISAGWYQASALFANGSVKNWGYNYWNDLGTGTATTTSTTNCYCLGPVSVSGLAGARSAPAGGYHGLALLSNGSAKAWGRNEYGQLGVGTATTTGCECTNTLVTVSGLSGPQALAAGGYHSLALLSNGTVQAWGYNGDGEVGDGSTTERDAPVPVGGLSGVSGISANDYNSFAIVGPSQTLNVSLAGAGAGAVGGGGPGILCPFSCTGRYPQGQVEILRAQPAPGVGFAGFSGACTGTAACEVVLGHDQTVTATFGAPKGTAITKAKINKKKHTASFSFSAPGAITGFQCALMKPKKKGKHHKKPKLVFSSCGSSKTYKHLKPGKYTFEVRALDTLGADATPAINKFKIKH